MGNLAQLNCTLQIVMSNLVLRIMDFKLTCGLVGYPIFIRPICDRSIPSFLSWAFGPLFFFINFFIYIHTHTFTLPISASFTKAIDSNHNHPFSILHFPPKWTPRNTMHVHPHHPLNFQSTMLMINHPPSQKKFVTPWLNSTIRTTTKPWILPRPPYPTTQTLALSALSCCHLKLGFIARKDSTIPYLSLRTVSTNSLKRSNTSKMPSTYPSERCSYAPAASPSGTSMSPHSSD